MTRGQRMPRPWRLMYRDTDPRCHDRARVYGTFRTKIGAERAQREAVPPPSIRPEHFHTWIEERP
jgi:hypothetical protein